MTVSPFAAHALPKIIAYGCERRARVGHRLCAAHRGPRVLNAQHHPTHTAICLPPQLRVIELFRLREQGPGATNTTRAMFLISLGSPHAMGDAWGVHAGACARTRAGVRRAKRNRLGCH